MKIRYTRSGGLPGITTSVDLDSLTIPSRQASEIHALMEKADLFHLPFKAGASQVADDLQHEIEIVDGLRHHRVCRADSQCSPELIRLFDRLQQEALARMRKRK